MLWVGAVGTVLFVMAFIVDGWSRPGYSPVRHPVSALALGSRGAVQTVNFLQCGCAVAVGATGLLIAGAHPALAAVLAVFGAALVASGVFPMDPMLGYPPGAPDGVPDESSHRHRLHDIAGAAVFLSLPTAMVIAALTLPGTGWRIGSGVAAVALFATSVRFARCWEEESAHLGLVQRGVIVPGWSWLAALFVLHVPA
ncbi:hypothetical protein FB384_002944 [Prauserella sediminis]|uniref:DUF998 domain-containing protein n=1 Tax=Prauserella sediminis TaxID=577680 RepID=A0A839XLB2_9PSEU|nr:DUF998 domain-containing protein [Prauserella sediminis]MBB3664040.1 hypothetical protein [Prauserella sediminis]